MPCAVLSTVSEPPSASAMLARKHRCWSGCVVSLGKLHQSQMARYRRRSSTPTTPWRRGCSIGTFRRTTFTSGFGEWTMTQRSLLGSSKSAHSDVTHARTREVVQGTSLLPSV